MEQRNKRRTRPVRPVNACCEPVILATFRRETLAEVGLRHVCWRRAGEVDVIDPDAWYYKNKIVPLV
jgi:hypothetical protein